MLTDEQKKVICFDWDYKDETRGLLRTHVSNNWQITKPHILSDFYTKKQQDVIHDIFKGIINPDWYTKFLKQLKDDTGGKEWGERAEHRHLRQAGRRQVRVRDDRPAHDAAGRRP